MLSTTRAFYGITAYFKLIHQHFAMVALDLDSPAFDSSAGTAFLLQLFGEDFEFVAIERHTSDYCDTFTPAAFCFTGETYDTVTLCMPDFI